MSERAEIADLRAFAEKIAREAGALLLERFAPTGGARTIEKKGVRELVTAADRASERLLVERIRARHPERAPRVEGSPFAVCRNQPSFCLEMPTTCSATCR